MFRRLSHPTLTAALSLVRRQPKEPPRDVFLTDIIRGKPFKPTVGHHDCYNKVTRPIPMTGERKGDYTIMSINCNERGRVIHGKLVNNMSPSRITLCIERNGRVPDISLVDVGESHRKPFWRRLI